MKLCLPAAAALLVLSGCSVTDAKYAHQAQTALVGMPETDLEACIGAPDQHATFGSTDILTYYSTTAAGGGVSLSLPIVGGISFSGSGSCHAIFRLDNGRVTELRYTGDPDATFGDDAYCAPIVRRCVQHPEGGAAKPPAGGT